MGFVELMAKVRESAAGTVAALDEFGKNKLGPALEDLGKHKLGPAFAHAGTALDQFSKNQLGPLFDDFRKMAGPAIAALEEVGKNLDDFGKNTHGPVLVNTGAVLDDFGKNRLGRVLADADPKVGKAGEESGQWIKENPRQTAIIAGTFVSCLFPGIVSAPLLWVFGWGSAGPRAASVASVIQSTRNVAAKGAFAHLQSAAMGGYGAAVVNTITSIGSGLVGATVGLYNVTASAIQTAGGNQ